MFASTHLSPFIFLVAHVASARDDKMKDSTSASPSSNVSVSGELDADRLMKRMFNAAIATAQPSLRVPDFLPTPPRGRLIVIGAGKASAAMAKQSKITGRVRWKESL